VVFIDVIYDFCDVLVCSVLEQRVKSLWDCEWTLFTCLTNESVLH